MLSLQSTRELLTKLQQCENIFLWWNADSIKTENSYIEGIEHVISLTEDPVLTTKLRRLSSFLNSQLKTMRALIDNGKNEHILKIDSSGKGWKKSFSYINDLPDNLTNKCKLYTNYGKLLLEIGTDREMTKCNLI